MTGALDTVSALMVDPVVLDVDQSPDVVGIQNTATNFLPILFVHVHDVLICNSGLHPGSFTRYQVHLRRCTVSDSFGHWEDICIYADHNELPCGDGDPRENSGETVVVV